MQCNSCSPYSIVSFNLVYFLLNEDFENKLLKLLHSMYQQKGYVFYLPRNISTVNIQTIWYFQYTQTIINFK